VRIARQAHESFGKRDVRVHPTKHAQLLKPNAHAARVAEAGLIVFVLGHGLNCAGKAHICMRCVIIALLARRRALQDAVKDYGVMDLTDFLGSTMFQDSGFTLDASRQLITFPR